MKRSLTCLWFGILISICGMSILFSASTPQIITFQGQLKENGYSVSGARSMRFEIVNASGTVFWQSHASNAVTVTVNSGVYTVALGDTSVANMGALSSAYLDKGEKLYLRVYVEGVQLSPDILLSSSSYAFIAGQAETVTANAAAGNSIGTALGVATQPAVLPKMTDAQMNAYATPANGSIIFNTSQEQLYWYNGSAWLPMGGTSANASYDTGWVACSDWTAQDLGSVLGGNVSHNLNANLSDLIVKLLISADGTDANSFEMNSEDSYRTDVGAGTRGVKISQVDMDTLKVLTAVNGVFGLDAAGDVFYLSSNSYYYKVKVFKPNQIVNGIEASDLLKKTGDTMSGALVVAATVNVTSGKLAESGNALVPAGSVQMYAGSTAPGGWFLCDGSAVSRTTYAALFSVIGTTYGSGDGSTTFNLPDCRGVFVRGAGTSGRLVNANSTSFNATLGAYQNDKIQGHWHDFQNGYYSFNLLSGLYSGNVVDIPGIEHVSYTASPRSDGTNGTPRTGSETNPANVAMNYIIKY